jgi:hypothetical protein
MTFEKMAAGDISLFTGPYMALTPDVLAQLREGIDEHERRYREDFPKLVEACPYLTRLAVACWTMNHVYEHARDGGTYRWMIYHRMGFEPDAYAPVMFAHGLDINNEFVVTETPAEDEALLKGIRSAIELLPDKSSERDGLYAVMRRFEELAEHARRSGTIINKQRAELELMARGGAGAEVAVQP